MPKPNLRIRFVLSKYLVFFRVNRVRLRVVRAFPTGSFLFDQQSTAILEHFRAGSTLGEAAKVFNKSGAEMHAICGLFIAERLIVPESFDEEKFIKNLPLNPTIGLLRDEKVTDLIRILSYANSHGATLEPHLGIGILYYSLTYFLRARVAVCLGSGSGFVPRLMRQAQLDLKMGAKGKTYLVDANLPGKRWGRPVWLEDEGLLKDYRGQIKILVKTTEEAAKHFFRPKKIRIDYLHIDADHSYEAASQDFHTYKRFLSANAVVTLHDTATERAGVRHLIDEIREMPDFQVVDFPDIGYGTALVRPRHVKFNWRE